MHSDQSSSNSDDPASSPAAQKKPRRRRPDHQELQSNRRDPQNPLSFPNQAPSSAAPSSAGPFRYPSSSGQSSSRIPTPPAHHEASHLHLTFQTATRTRNQEPHQSATSEIPPPTAPPTPSLPPTNNSPETHPDTYSHSPSPVIGQKL